MSKNELRQDQSQIMNVGEHGALKKITCVYVNPNEPRNIVTAYNQVDILYYQGEVKRVFCQKFEDGNCSAPKYEKKKCYLYKN